MTLKKVLYAIIALLIFFMIAVAYLFYIDTHQQETYIDTIQENNPELYEAECREANALEYIFRRCIGWDK